MTAAEIAAGVQTGAHAASAVIGAVLERVERHDPVLNAFLHVMRAEALAAAAALDRRRAGGETGGLGPLAGVPIAVKDNLATADAPTTCASRILSGFRPAFDATAVARLRAAGAVILGKTNMDEFGMGSSGENSAYGPTKNPWDPERVPGGSSSGSAAAVAAGVVPLALGSDTGGSVRQPAGFCGIFGLKPTYGRVSRFGLVAYASSLDQVGLLARTLADLELAFAVLAAPDPRDSTSHPEADRFPDPELSPAPRLGVPLALLGPGLDSDTATVAAATVERFRAAGARVVEITFPRPEHALAAYYIIATAEAAANLARYDGVRYGPRAEGKLAFSDMVARTRAAGFGPEVKRRIMLGTYALRAGYYDAYYLRAQQARALIHDELSTRLRDVDAILLPVSPTVAFRLGERTTEPLAMYLSDLLTIPVNLAGLPGLCFPAGRGPATGLPVGMQLVGRPFAEGTLCALARRIGAEAAASPLAGDVGRSDRESRPGDAWRDRPRD